MSWTTNNRSVSASVRNGGQKPSKRVMVKNIPPTAQGNAQVHTAARSSVGIQAYLFLRRRPVAGGEGGCNGSRPTKTLGTLNQFSGSFSLSFSVELQVRSTWTGLTEFCSPYFTLFVRRRSIFRRQFIANSHLFRISLSERDLPAFFPNTQSLRIFQMIKNDSEIRIQYSRDAPGSCLPFSSFMCVGPQPRMAPMDSVGHVGFFFSQSSFARL